MAEPLKAMYNEQFLREFGEKIRGVHNVFETEAFVSSAMTEPWETLELKARMRRITETLGSHLKLPYEEALAILFAIADDCVGFPYLIFPDFVEVYGQETIIGNCLCRRWKDSQRNHRLNLQLGRFSYGNQSG